MRCARSLSVVLVAAACCIGVGQSTDGLFDCDDAFENWEKSWEPEKKRWCCANRGRGCHLFDCNDGLESWQAEWSHDKKVSCCFETGHGCDGSNGPPPDSSAPAPIDCNAILNNGEEAFSSQQKDWCCVTHHIACRDWDCNFAAPEFWPDEKKEFCCSQTGQGCPGQPAPPEQSAPVTPPPLEQSEPVPPPPPEQPEPVPPPPPEQPAPVTPPPPEQTVLEFPSKSFDCGKGYERWEASWSDNKIKWCCDNQNIACEPWDCIEGGQGAWPEAKKEYCCKTQSLACPADFVSKAKVGLPSLWVVASTHMPAPLAMVSVAVGALAVALLLAVRLRPTSRPHVPDEDPSVALVEATIDRLAGGTVEDSGICE